MDIELVIKIPKHYYENNIKKELPIYVSEDDIVTILPKGHGDLKDMGNLQYVFDLNREGPIYSGKDIEKGIKMMKTIIGADTQVYCDDCKTPCIMYEKGMGRGEHD